MQLKFEFSENWKLKISFLKKSCLFYLDTNRQIVLFDPFKVQWVVDLDVSVSPSVLQPLLKVKRVVFVGLIGRSSNQLVEHGGVAFNSGTVKTSSVKTFD